ncbi:hypothetical protein V1L54_11695 [Streptomyces sp. TRM 70361]|uniref:hypothetical protein n=1 Tax=Streptomyces sp. TRM 70361 TaxID=3116553 RepID=UPI002E7B1953|nr:hypothetical protein [Streptomyces sp. TRM 70361]MEE1940051.1 hypothetical protein [Streptomyces sp. TRM 70361]
MIDVMSYVPPEVVDVLRRRFPERSGEEIDAQLGECLKFLYVVSAEEATFLPLTREVDETWHELILQTAFYQKLCAALPGGRFLHHHPAPLGKYADQLGRRESVRRLLQWIPWYVAYFGGFSEETARYWVIVDLLRTRLGMSLEEINELGRRELRSRAA